MLSPVDVLVTAQWAALRSFVGTLTEDQRAQPSTLPTWSVDDLISHLARTCDAIAALRPVESDDEGKDVPADTVMVTPEEASTLAGEPLTAGDYLAGYAARAEQISELTTKAARGSAGDRLGELDAAFTQAQRTLGALNGRNAWVKVTGGVMRLSAFLDTRLVELVVHGLDLADSLPETTGPHIFDGALGRVETVLREAFSAKAGVLGEDADLAALPAREFVLIATGRREPPESLAAAVRAELPVL